MGRPMGGQNNYQPQQNSFYQPAPSNGYPVDNRSQQQYLPSNGQQPPANGYVNTGYPPINSYNNPRQQQDWWSGAN